MDEVNLEGYMYPEVFYGVSQDVIVFGSLVSGKKVFVRYKPNPTEDLLLEASKTRIMFERKIIESITNPPNLKTVYVPGNSQANHIRDRF